MLVLVLVPELVLMVPGLVQNPKTSATVLTAKVGWLVHSLPVSLRLSVTYVQTLALVFHAV